MLKMLRKTRSKGEAHRPLPLPPEDPTDVYEYLDVAKIPLSSPRSVNGAAAASPLADPRDPQTEIQQLANALQLDSKTEVCQSENCEKEIDGFCTKCNQLICYRCSKKTKCSMDGEHEFADIDQYKAAKQAMYDMWYTGKKNHTIAMDQEMRALALFVQKEAARLANDSLSGIVSSLSKTIATLTNKQNEIRTLSHKLSEVRSVVTYYTDNIGKLSSPGFVKLVNTLVMPESGKVKKYNVGRVDSLVAKSCEYMALTKDKNMIASSNSSVELFSPTSNTPLSSQLPIPGHVCGMQWSNNRLYAMEELGDTGAKVHIYDEHFSQWGSWLVRKKVCDLAVNNEQVYLCTATCNILVFSTDGHFQYEIEGDLGQRITHHSKADMLVITNHSSDTVSFLNGRTKEVEWTIEVEKPWGAYVDEYEAIWVWSEFNQEFEIYDSKGEFVQSAGHPRMIGIGEINTCCVHSGYLWMGYDGGIYRFAVGFR